ncbi:MAG: DUF6781 family protein [Planctomycetota bacterium]
MDTSGVRETIGRIASEGEDVTRRVREAVEAAAESLGDAGGSAQHRLTSLVSAAIDGASSAVADATPEEAQSTLRQVIDGLGEGLQRTANATRLAVEESASGGKAYAAEDLRGIADDFKSIGELFAETVEKHASGIMGQAAEQVAAVRSHAERTIEGVRPSLESAASAAMKDPSALAGEAAEAAVDMARQAAGSLFGAVGKMLTDAGDRLDKPKG